MNFLQKLLLNHFKKNNFNFTEKRLAFEDAPTDPPSETEDEKTAREEKEKEDSNSKKSNFKKLQESRDSHKERADKLEAEKKGTDEKLAKEKEDKLKSEGKFEELFNLEKAKNEKNNSRLDKIETHFNNIEISNQKKITESIATIPEDKRPFINRLIDGKTTEEKMGLLPDLIKEFGTPEGGQKKENKKQVGSPKPEGGKTPTEIEVNADKTRFRELIDKQNEGKASRSEVRESHNLSKKLSRLLSSDLIKKADDQNNRNQLEAQKNQF